MSFTIACPSGSHEAQRAGRNGVANGESGDTGSEYFRLLPVVRFWSARVAPAAGIVLRGVKDSVGGESVQTGCAARRLLLPG